MRSHEETIEIVQLDEDYQQYLDSKRQHDENFQRITANGPIEYVEIVARNQLPIHESRLKENGFTFSFSYEDVDIPEGDKMNVWMRPSTRTLQLDFGDLPSV